MTSPNDAVNPATAPATTPATNASAAAFEKLRARLFALPAAALQPPRPDLRPLLSACAALAQEAASPALRERLARLPKEEFDLANLELLTTAAAALEHARAQLDAALAPSDPQLPAELVEQSGQLKERMLRVARYHLEDDAELRKTLLALQRKRTSNSELIGDLRRLAIIYRDRKELLATDTRHYRTTDEADADKVANDISAHLSAVRGEAIHAATEVTARAQALLSAAYEEIRAAAVFLLRKEAGVEARIPALAALPSAKRGRKAQAPGELPDA